MSISTLAYTSRLVLVAFITSSIAMLVDWALEETGYKESLPHRETPFMRLALMTFEVMVGVFFSRLALDHFAATAALEPPSASMLSAATS